MNEKTIEGLAALAMLPVVLALYVLYARKRKQIDLQLVKVGQGCIAILAIPIIVVVVGVVGVVIARVATSVYSWARDGLQFGHDPRMGLFGLILIWFVTVFPLLLISAFVTEKYSVVKQRESVIVIVTVMLSFVVPLAIARNILLEPENSPSKAIALGLKGVCSEGKGTLDAAPFSDEHLPHPLLVLDQSGNVNWYTDRMPNNWHPTGVDSTQLVACISQKKETLETCNYRGGGVQFRYQYQATVRLLKAQTGELISNTTLYGSRPDCDSTITLGTGNKEGTTVDEKQLIDWLKPYVEGRK